MPSSVAFSVSVPPEMVTLPSEVVSGFSPVSGDALTGIAACRDAQRAAGNIQLIVAGQTVVRGVDVQFNLRNRNHRVSCTLDAVFRVAVNGQRARASDGERQTRSAQW